MWSVELHLSGAGQLSLSIIIVLAAATLQLVPVPG